MAGKVTLYTTAFLLLLVLASAAPAEKLKAAPVKNLIPAPAAAEKADLVAEDLKPAASHWGGGWGYGGYGGWGHYGGHYPYYGSYWGYPSYSWGGYGFGWPYYGSGFGHGYWW